MVTMTVVVTLAATATSPTCDFLVLLLYGSSEPELEPVCACDNGAGQHQKDDQQDDPTSTPGARHPSPKTELLLQPIKDPIQERQFEQAGQTTRSIVHSPSPLFPFR